MLNIPKMTVTGSLVSITVAVTITLLAIKIESEKTKTSCAETIAKLDNRITKLESHFAGDN